MSTVEKDEKLKVIEHDPTFRDVFAEVVGMTEYNVNGVNYVNLSFLGNKVASLVDEHGRPVSSRIELRKVGSVTMTLDRAVALRDALVKGLIDNDQEKGGS